MALFGTVGKGTSKVPVACCLEVFLSELTIQPFFILMPSELAHQERYPQHCVALRHQLRIRLHPSMASLCGIASNRG